MAKLVVSNATKVTLIVNYTKLLTTAVSLSSAVSASTFTSTFASHFVISITLIKIGEVR